MLWLIPGTIRTKASEMFVNHDMKNANMTKKFDESGKNIKTQSADGHHKTSWHTARMKSGLRNIHNQSTLQP